MVVVVVSLLSCLVVVVVVVVFVDLEEHAEKMAKNLLDQFILDALLSERKRYEITPEQCVFALQKLKHHDVCHLLGKDGEGEINGIVTLVKGFIVNTGPKRLEVA